MEVITEALILSIIPYREKDLILELVTKDEGLCSALARGSVASKKRYGFSLDYFNLLRVSLKKGRTKGMYRLQWSEPIEVFEGFRTDLSRYSAGMMLLYIIKIAIRHTNPDDISFSEVLSWIKELDKNDKPWIYSVKQVVDLFERLGFPLKNTSCFNCSKELSIAGCIDNQSHPLCGLCCNINRGYRLDQGFLDVISGKSQDNIKISNIIKDLEHFVQGIIEKNVDLQRFYQLSK